MTYKIGDEVIIVLANDGDWQARQNIGKAGTIVANDNSQYPFKVRFEDESDEYWYAADEFRKATKLDKVLK